MNCEKWVTNSGSATAQVDQSMPFGLTCSMEAFGEAAAIMEKIMVLAGKYSAMYWISARINLDFICRKKIGLHFRLHLIFKQNRNLLCSKSFSLFCSAC
jgi:hypothetical protein